MKIGIPGALLGAAIVMFIMGMLFGEEEPILLAAMTVGASVLTYLVTLRAELGEKKVPGEVERRLKELEHRLSLTEGELDLASAQIERLRAERDFDRQLEAGRGLAIGRATGPVD
jgi:hypothetical protein